MLRVTGSPAPYLLTLIASRPIISLFLIRNYELRIRNYELGITNFQLRIRNYELRITNF
jgi:hypothetical protein